ncbi:uracil phosphoribosyltransferase [Anaerofustis stercorihominis]|uniref:uracil phosphoribosyltransferase n=1 Tax=Anaerofustis stercorihominis TaxID=214853 RepID=UPI00214CFAF5|nr:uracil phosphoribosyltransferase [Anaerofustis stercorihominis]MCR2032693.1 uracil phosphoribosyltransferase [Anaerofustis stercorihominis]
MSKIVIAEHPIIKDYLSKIRNKQTDTKTFRDSIKQLSVLIGYEATRNLKTQNIEVETPLCTAQCEKLINEDITIVPILRAGLGMLEGMLELLPNARVGHIGLERNEETLKPREYYFKMPGNYETMQTFVVDPMLATGGSAVDAIDKIKEKGIKNITFICVIAAPEGVNKLKEAHPDIDIYMGTLDDHLNENGYIVPGLGDAGDRIFGTL